MKSKNNKNKWAIGIVVLVAALIFFIPRIRGQRQVIGDEVEVKTGNIETFYSFSGSVEAKNRQMIFADGAIQIKELKVGEGELVQKDDIIYRTNRGEDIKAPIKGEIANIFVEEDQQLVPGDKIIEIVDYDELQLKVKVDEYDLNAIKEDLLASVTINSLDKDVEGIVKDISKEGVYMNGVTFFDTRISIANEGDILIGMSAEAKILNEKAEAVPILPMTALKFHDDNSAYVNIKNDQIIEGKEVELGITDGINVEIKSGLKSGDKVFLQKSTNIRFGPPEGARGMGGGGDN